MYPLKTIATDTELFVGKNNFKYGQILTTLLNVNFDEILSLDDFLMTLIFQDISKQNLDEVLLSFSKIDAIMLKLDFYKDNISAEHTLSSSLTSFKKTLSHKEYLGMIREVAMKFSKLLEDLNEIDGFYRKYIEEYYHDFEYYPKSLDIAKSFNKYRDDFPDLDEIDSKYKTPEMVMSFASPIIADDGRVYEVHYHETLSSLVYKDFMECIKREIMPKKCKNCSRFYIPSFGYFSEYCTNVAPNETAKTCREIGSKASFDKKLDDEPILKEYQKAYKTHHARFVKKNMTKEQLADWKIFAKKMRDKALANEITFEEYLAAIKK